MQARPLISLGAFVVILSIAGCPTADVVVGGSSDTGGDPDTGNGVGDTVEDHRTYYIGESTKFNGGGKCNNANVNTVTRSLRDELADAGWTGSRLVNENSWPEHFWEGTFEQTAVDGTYGDAVRLAVYAGHGSVGQLQWGSPSPNGACQTRIPSDSRLGTLDGDTAAAVMLLASCTMRADLLWPMYRQQMSRQIFGYHNSPHIGPQEPRKVFARTRDGQATSDAWLEEMVINGVGKYSPLVFTKGVTYDEAQSMHGETNLATGQGFITNVGEPANAYYFELYDSGCSQVCGACAGNDTALPEITLGSAARRVALSRPFWASRELIEHTTTALELFGVGTLDSAARMRLRIWADAIVSRGEIGYVLVLDEPRIDVTYDPDESLLRITDRDALARARPLAGQSVDDPPDLQAKLLLVAESVRGRLQEIPAALDLLGTSFSVTTRVVGYGHGNRSPITAAFEYMFTLSGQFEGFALPNRHLGIGITRLGELSMITLSTVEVEVVGPGRFERQPQDALDDLTAKLLAQYPNVTQVEIVEPRIGYVLAEAEVSAVAEPSLIVGYALRFGEGEDGVASRRYPVRISLAVPDASIEPLAEVVLDTPPGGDRASN